jgi:general secretion pathway protein I
MKTRPHGFSLVEMLVAMAILALSLGVLYQAAAGSTRNVRIDERYTYAVQIAQSLLAEHPSLLPEGINAAGRVSDFQWRLQSSTVESPMQAPAPSDEFAPTVDLLQLDAVVRWEGPDGREVRLVTIVPVHTFVEEPVDVF